MAQRFEDVKKIDLAEIFQVKDFRLIREEHRKIKGGISEIPVKVDLKKEFAKSLNFKAPWDGEFYGFIKCKYDLFKKTGYDNTKRITIVDWDSHCVMIFEDDKGNEEPIYSASKDELKKLLENCRKPEKLIN